MLKCSSFKMMIYWKKKKSRKIKLKSQSPTNRKKTVEEFRRHFSKKHKTKNQIKSKFLEFFCV